MKRWIEKKEGTEEAAKLEASTRSKSGFLRSRCIHDSSRISYWAAFTVSPTHKLGKVSNLLRYSGGSNMIIKQNILPLHPTIFSLRGAERRFPSLHHDGCYAGVDLHRELNRIRVT